MIPLIIPQIFPPNLRESLIADCNRFIAKGDLIPNPRYGRHISNDTSLDTYAEYLVEIVREVFNEATAQPTYACWARYESVASRLPPHVDTNACQFTVDYCLRQQHPWPLFVEGREYVLEPNQALAFRGEEQLHWRPPFAAGNSVEMIFFHFAAADHWYFNP